MKWIKAKNHWRCNGKKYTYAFTDKMLLIEHHTYTLISLSFMRVVLSVKDFATAKTITKKLYK